MRHIFLFVTDTLFYQIQYVSIEKPNDNTSRAACNIVKKTVTMPQKKLLCERSINIKGTSVHEHIKTKGRSRKRTKFDSIVGSAVHEHIKTQDMAKKVTTRECIVGSALHELKKKVERESKEGVAMKKVQINNLTAGMLTSNFKDNVKSFIAKDEGYNFMNTIKGTPAYWNRFLFEVLGMVKQLGLPTFFMTLSCADLRWDELVSIISKLNCIKEVDIEKLSYFERCQILNMNPVVVAKHFQYRVEVFFKEIIVDGPLGKVKCYAIRVEFQFRGSPHIHSFLWVVNAPILTKETKQEYIQFIDQIVKANIPGPEENHKLHKLVKTY